jgi:hypothetical protein
LHYLKRVDDEIRPVQKVTNPAGTGLIKSSCATRTTHLVEVLIMAHAIGGEQARRLMLINYPLIRTRDDLSFTARDVQGRMVNWPRNNPGVAADWEKGMTFFDEEVSALAAFDETEAFHAIQFAIIGMGGRYTNLEIGFAERVAAAAVLGLRAMRNGEADFVPVDQEDN